MTRALETTPAMCESALRAMEVDNGMDTWLAKDAAAAHELLELVRMLAPLVENIGDENRAALAAAAPWLEV